MHITFQILQKIAYAKQDSDVIAKMKGTYKERGNKKKEEEKKKKKAKEAKGAAAAAAAAAMAAANAAVGKCNGINFLKLEKSFCQKIIKLFRICIAIYFFKTFLFLEQYL